MHLRCRLLSSSTINAKTLAFNYSSSSGIFISQSRNFSTTKNEEGQVEADKKTGEDKIINKTDDSNSNKTSTAVNDGNSTKFNFPWRHSTNMLPRIDPLSSEYNPHGPELWIPTTSMAPLKKIGRHAIVARFLGKSWFDIISGNWENELCDNFTWAFGRSISSLLGNMFHLPIDQLEKQQKANIDSEPDNSNDTTTSNLIEVDFDSSITEAITFDDNNRTNKFALKMLEQNVLDQYKNVATAASNVHMRLLTRPLSAKIVNLNIIPYSRDLSQKNPELKGLYCRYLAAQHAENMDEHATLQQQMFRAIDRINGSSKKVLKVAIISQALIHCKEIFYIKDKDTGKVIQGEESDIEKDVYHLVRFEIPIELTLEKRIYRLLFSQGNPTSWIVSDYDDLLNGNVYY